jgi:hypothetical protein
VDIGVTDVVLEITVNKTFHNQQVSLERDGQVIRQLICSSDSLIYDGNLLPDQYYTYQAFLLDKGEKVCGTTEVKIITMDTTSHEFERETFSFGGQRGSSTFYDVAIINDNDIWVVGEVYTEDSYTYDSLGNWIDPYNAVHWNGEKWELRRIYYIYQGSNSWSPIRTILAFSSSDIWFGSGIYWDGNQFNTKLMNIEFPYRVHRMWGISSLIFFIVGNEGAIACLSGNTWRKIESGISENIQDIWGIFDNETNQPFILCAASQKLFPSEKIIFNIQPDGTVIKDNWPFDDRKPYSVWFKNRYKAFACGDGVFIRDFYGNWKILYDGIPYFLNHLRGTDVNNIFAVDDFGYINHFNGSTWQALPTNTDGRYLAVAAKDDIAVAVGDGAGGRPAVATFIKKKN